MALTTVRKQINLKSDLVPVSTVPDLLGALSPVHMGQHSGNNVAYNNVASNI